METTLEYKIKVMQAFLNGEKIEFNYINDKWADCTTPTWTWSTYNYRTKEKQLPKPEDYKQVKYKYKDYETVFITAHAFLTIEDFYNTYEIKPTDIEWAILF